MGQRHSERHPGKTPRSFWGRTEAVPLGAEAVLGVPRC